MDKYVRSVSEDENSKILCVSVRDGKIVISGEGVIVDIFKNAETISEMKVRDLLENIQKTTTNQKYEMYHPIIFPPLSHKFGSPSWTWSVAQENLKVFFNVMGFGRGSQKEFGKEESRPEWWPEDDSNAKLIWTNYKHPSYTSLEHCNILFRSIFEFYGLDEETFFSNDGGRIGRSKRVKRKTSRRFIDDDSSSSEENTGDNDAIHNELTVTEPVDNDDQTFGEPDEPLDAVTNDDDSSIASANSEEMALFDEVMDDEDFAEEMEFTGEVRPATPVIPSCSGTPGVIFDKSARKKRTTSN